MTGIFGNGSGAVQFLREQLASAGLGKGAAMVAFKSAIADAFSQPWTVQGKLENTIDIFENLTDEERTRVMLRTGMSVPVLDLTAKINAVLIRAKTNKKRAFAPAGLYPHNGQIVVDAIEMFGEGINTEFRSTDTTAPSPQHAIQLTGNGVALRHCSTSTTWAGGRQTNSAGHAVSLIDCTNFAVEFVTVTGAATAGILGQFCRNGVVNRCRVKDTQADGIHFTNDSHYIAILNNYTENTGDDNIAVVAYQEPRPVEYGGGTWPQSSGFASLS